MFVVFVTLKFVKCSREPSPTWNNYMIGCLMKDWLLNNTDVDDVDSQTQYVTHFFTTIYDIISCSISFQLSHIRFCDLLHTAVCYMSLVHSTQLYRSTN